MGFRKLRAAAALLCCIVGITWSSIGLIAQPKYEFDAVANENRLTKLETQLSSVVTQMNLALLILSGLAGEAGIRIYNKKKGGDE